MIEGPNGTPIRGIKERASKQCALSNDQRQKNPTLLASRTPVGVKLQGASVEGPNRFLATHMPKARLFTRSLIRRTAGCGPACPVVWEGRTSDRPPYPDLGKGFNVSGFQG